MWNKEKQDWKLFSLNALARCLGIYRQAWIVQGGPERSRQSNLAVFAVEGGLDSKFTHVK